MFYISKGHCCIVNKDDGYQSRVLGSGDFFGESELIKCVDFTFFGDIIAQDDVECWCLPHEYYDKIPYFEQNLMQEYA